KENFVVESKPDRDMNGDYIQGSLIVRPRQDVDGQVEVEKLFTEDEKMRKSSGEQARGNVSLNRSISTDNLEEINNISSYVKDGMSIQGNKIMYDENNSKHVKSIEALKRKVMVERSDKHKDKVG